MTDTAPATEPAPPPAPLEPPPMLTRESFAGLLAIVEDLLAVGHMCNEGRRIPVDPKHAHALTAALQVLSAVGMQHQNLSEAALHAWVARASAIAAFTADLTVKLLADLTDRQMASAIVAPNGEAAAAVAAEQSKIVDLAGRPMAAPARPTLPPHLQALVGAHTFSIETLQGGAWHRVTCHTCHKALGEVRELEVAELIGTTHASARGGERVEWVHPSASPIFAVAYDVPTCRKCGCTETNACLKILDLGPDKPRPVVQHCSWSQLNPETNAGICTACAE